MDDLNIPEDFVHRPYVYTKGSEIEAGLLHAHIGAPGASLDVKLPNIGAAAGCVGDGIKFFANAELASFQGTAGPLQTKLGLAADTGAGIGKDGVEAKFLGTGFSFGRKMGFSLFGSELSFKLW